MAVKLNVHLQEVPRTFPTFERPEVVGYYSLNNERQFCDDLSELKYLVPHHRRKRNHNLNYKIEDIIKKDEDLNERLDTILQWILRNSHNLKDDSGTRLRTDFVCFRGLLTMLICTPYETRDDWIICASKWKGTIYLCAFETEDAKRQRLQASGHQKKCMAWGRKFEQYMATANPGGCPDVEQPINEKAEFCVAFQSKLKNHRLLYCAEMDCVKTDTEVQDLKELQKTEFVEIKTSRIITHPGQYRSLKRFKFMKWWAQSFLVNISCIICGFRNDEGIVKEVREYSVPELAKSSKDTWNAAAGLNFCETFLDFVKNTVKEESLEVVWKFDWGPNRDVCGVKLTGVTDFSILPPWYTDNLILSAS